MGKMLAEHNKARGSSGEQVINRAMPVRQCEQGERNLDAPPAALHGADEAGTGYTGRTQR